MSARASGPGGRAARRRCGRMSTMCFACCRSSRQRLSASAARPAPCRPPADHRARHACSGRRRSGSDPCRPADEKTLLLLPGSRTGEVSRLIEPFGETRARSCATAATGCGCPVADRAERRATGRGGDGELAASSPRSSSTEAGKWQAFGEADAALCASGTVSLELALAGVPLVACYRLDWLARQAAASWSPSWSASLPNLIADRAVVPEYLQRFVTARASGAPTRELLFRRHRRARWQLDGFDRGQRRRMADRRAVRRDRGGRGAAKLA